MRVATLRVRATGIGIALMLGLLSSLVTVSVVGATTPTVQCTGTLFFASAGADTEFHTGDTWQGGTFTFIENDHFMRVREEVTGDLVGRFPMGFLLGDMATITFDRTINITGIFWYDNDPNPGEAGWSVNGTPGPITGNGGSAFTPANLTTDTVMIDAGGDSGGIDFCYTEVVITAQGCTPGYWKNHTDSWAPSGFTTGQTLESVFDVPDSLGMDNVTLHEALQGGGGPGVAGAAKILLRAGTAALLNAAHPGVATVDSASSIISQVNAALASNSRDTMLALASDLDTANNAGCPLN